LTAVVGATGRQFYGPDGIYPFAGRECARAFALLSTDTSDCVESTDGLDKMELDNLRDWQEKFYTKYKLVGKVVSKKEN
jgi:membrane-associated progesterone receptor component